MTGAVTYDEVVSAAIRLIRNATNPSIKAIRKELGDRGSESTILKYLKHWRSGLNESDLEVLPPSMPKELTGHIEALWNAMGSLQEDALQEERTKSQASVKTALEQKEEAEHNLDELRQRNEVLEAKLLQTMDTVDSYKKTTEDLRDNIKEKNSEIDQLLVKIQQSDDALSQLKQHYEDRITAMEERHDEAVRVIRTEHKIETDSLNTALEESANRVRLEEQRTDKQIDYWMMQIDEERERSKLERSRSDDAIKRVEQELTISRRREDSASVRLGAMESKIESLETESSELSAQLAAEKDLNKEVDRELSVLKQQNEDQSKEISALLDQIYRDGEEYVPSKHHD